MTYETDFYEWTQQQATLLRQQEFSAVDWEHLIEEIEDMSGSERRALASQLHRALVHLLKWQFQPDRRGPSWRNSIRNARRNIERSLDYSPSLKPQIPAMIAREFPRARCDATDETGLPDETFPETCPYTVEQVTSEWWPE